MAIDEVGIGSTLATLLTYLKRQIIGFLFMDMEKMPETEIQRQSGFAPGAGADASRHGAAPPWEMIRLPAKRNRLLQQILARINADEDLHTLWRCQNLNAVTGWMSDHGPIHMQIVVNISLRILRMLLGENWCPTW